MHKSPPVRMTAFLRNLRRFMIGRFGRIGAAAEVWIGNQPSEIYNKPKR